MLHVFFNKELKSCIDMESFGIVIRPLTEEEKIKIIQRYDELFFSKKAKSKYKQYIENISAQLTADEYSAGFIKKRYDEFGIEFNKTILKKQLKRIGILEFKEKVHDFIEEEIERILLSNIIKTLLLKKGHKSLNELRGMMICWEKLDLFSENILDSTNAIMNCIGKEVPKIIDIIELEQQDFMEFEKFTKMLTTERIRDFVLVMENVWGGDNSASNELLNYVSCLERILVKYENNDKYDIGKQLILKLGLCINDNLNTEEDIGEQLDLIRFSYAIRSYIIHGNERDLLNAPNKYLKKSEQTIRSFTKDYKPYKRRFFYIWIAKQFIEGKLCVVLKEWIENTERIEFLKNN